MASATIEPEAPEVDPIAAGPEEDEDDSDVDEIDSDLEDDYGDE